MTLTAAPGHEPLELVARGRALLPDGRGRRDLDAVARDAADEQIAVGRERDLPGLLRLPVELAPGGHGAVGLEHEERRVDGRRAVGQHDRELEGRLAVDAEPLGVVHAVDVDDAEVAGELERRGDQRVGGGAVGAVHDREDLGAAQADRQRRHERRAVGRRVDVGGIEGHQLQRAGGVNSSSDVPVGVAHVDAAAARVGAACRPRPARTPPRRPPRRRRASSASMSSQVTQTCAKPTSAVRSATLAAARRAELEQLDARALAAERELRRAHVDAVLADDRLEVAALPVLLHHDLHAPSASLQNASARSRFETVRPVWWNCAIDAQSLNRVAAVDDDRLPGDPGRRRPRAGTPPARRCRRARRCGAADGARRWPARARRSSSRPR